MDPATLSTDPPAMNRTTTVLLLLAIAATAGTLLLPAAADSAPAAIACAHPAELSTAPAAVSTRPSTGFDHERRAVPTTPEPTLRPRPTIRLRVVDRATVEPVAGAEVLSMQDESWRPIEALPPDEFDAMQRDAERTFRAFGSSGRTDRDGRIDLPIDGQQVDVVARSGLRVGGGWFRRGPERVLAIGPAATVHVRVVDAAGAVAGRVPVVLELDTPWQTARSQRLVSVTADSGIATFVDVPMQVTCDGRPAAAPFAAFAVRIPGIDLAPLIVDDTPPTLPIEVRLPPTGRLRVRVLLGGVPLSGLERLQILREWTAPIDTQGGALFAHVPLGQRVHVTAYRFGHHWPGFEAATPTVAGHEVAASLELGDHVVAVTGRLFHADGRAVCRESVRVWYSVTNGGGNNWVYTDGHGDFLWVLGSPASGRATRLLGADFAVDLGNRRRARIEIGARDLAPGRNDLGPLRLRSD